MKMLPALLYLVNLHKCWFGHRNIKYCVVKVYKQHKSPHPCVFKSTNKEITWSFLYNPAIILISFILFSESCVCGLVCQCLWHRNGSLMCRTTKSGREKQCHGELMSAGSGTDNMKSLHSSRHNSTEESGRNLSSPLYRYMAENTIKKHKCSVRLIFLHRFCFHSYSYHPEHVHMLFKNNMQRIKLLSTYSYVQPTMMNVKEHTPHRHV